MIPANDQNPGNFPEYLSSTINFIIYNKISMSDEPPIDSTDEMEEALRESSTTRYLLRLYVVGDSPKTRTAIANLQDLCEKRLKGRYQLDVIDISKNPQVAISEQIVAIPTLVKVLPLPIRRIIGDLSKPQRVIVGLDLINLDD
jgi:circadian clock protein KaiB